MTTTCPEQHKESMMEYAIRVQMEGDRELHQMRREGSNIMIALGIAYEAIYNRSPAGEPRFDPRIDISGHGYIQALLAKMYENATGYKHRIVFTMALKPGEDKIYIPTFEITPDGFVYAACNQHAKREYLKELIENLKNFELVI